MCRANILRVAREYAFSILKNKRFKQHFSKYLKYTENTIILNNKTQ